MSRETAIATCRCEGGGYGRGDSEGGRWKVGGEEVSRKVLYDCIIGRLIPLCRFLE